jgi:hypothetical protein
MNPAKKRGFFMVDYIYIMSERMDRGNNSHANRLLKEINARFDGDAHQKAAAAGKSEEDMVNDLLDHLAEDGFAFTNEDVVNALQKAQNVHIQLGINGRLSQAQVRSANEVGMKFLDIYLRIKR